MGAKTGRMVGVTSQREGWPAGRGGNSPHTALSRAGDLRKGQDSEVSRRQPGGKGWEGLLETLKLTP